ncbi:low molecular weight phosphotyrosine protein phosphatase [Antarcticibacterium flavum]|uniref:protein-tyrosine-phosphatase n=1 Tax=Antarcticibacterium flavum TaxID=2058175 RepID=A0A5B7X6W2_9FLAO|nr:MULTISPECIES: low molecular weight protein-tyrosine-phosphatase [Antarcticibacterium]MCM4161081.1 protein-tyrosine-phosphatase [Antarcticibacterium sp. W02-3]QCY70492.1 low molecular weight phosphotyrosine protein phosphatase [Antarcticibacterium flavum]
MKTRVLMVCLGNICRSPLAEGILKSKVDPNKVYIESAGTGDYHIDDSPDPRSIAVGKRHGLDITDQRGRQFSPEDFDRFDHIYVMDTFNYADVISLARNEEDKRKVKLILDEVFPGEKVDVPDPYHGGEHGFENVYEMLNEACEMIASKLEKEK